MTQTEAFEANLSQSTDSTVLRGKLVFSNSATTTPSAALSLTPQSASNFGARAAALSAIFSRYRFKYLNVRFLPTNTAGGGIVTVGVQDDINVAATAPVSPAGVAELRCSGTAFGLQTVPTQFKWQPVDRSKWYYTFNDGTDARLSTTGILWTSSTTTSGTLADLEVDFCIVFQGAIDTATL